MGQPSDIEMLDRFGQASKLKEEKTGAGLKHVFSMLRDMRRADKEAGRKPKTKIEQWDQEIEMMMSSKNPEIRKLGIDQSRYYHQRNTQDERGGADGGGKPPLIPQAEWDAKTQAQKDDYNWYYRGAQRSGKIQSAQMLMNAKNPAEYAQLVAALGMNNVLDIGDRFIDTALLGLPVDQQMMVRKNIAESKAQEQIGKHEGEYLTGFSKMMRSQNTAYSQLTHTLSALNNLADVTGYNTTSFGKFLNILPGSESLEWKKRKDHLMSRLSIQQMMSMKENSPNHSTGFGALSEKELGVLMDYMVSLDQAQDGNEIKHAMGKVYGQLRKVQKEIRVNQKEWINQYGTAAKKHNQPALPTDYMDDDRYQPEYVPEILRGSTYEDPAPGGGQWLPIERVKNPDPSMRYYLDKHGDMQMEPK